MNVVAVRRLALGCLVIGFAAPVRGQEVRPPPVDLVYRSLDLKYAVEDVRGATQSTAGDVVDLKKKGLDIEESATEIKINLLGDILFDFDKATIRGAAEPTLAQIAKFIQGRGQAKVLIEGHTDAKGSNSYNARLSERRAASVKDWFGKHGVSVKTIETRGWGAAKPVAPNKKPDGSDDPDGRQKNRRVEITIKK